MSVSGARYRILLQALDKQDFFCSPHEVHSEFLRYELSGPFYKRMRPEYFEEFTEQL